MQEQIYAVTFDFYHTLACQRDGVGRGLHFHEYLMNESLDADPWDPQLLYKAFEYYGQAYHPTLADYEKTLFWEEFTSRLFAMANVRGFGSKDYRRHGLRVRRIFDVSTLTLYEDVTDTLQALHEAGIPMAVVSNWHRGLQYFCMELGIAGYFHTVIASDEVGMGKPDPRIFELACGSMGVSCRNTMHVGDTYIDDIEGARGAGCRATMISRDTSVTGVDVPVVRSLREVPSLIG